MRPQRSHLLFIGLGLLILLVAATFSDLARPLAAPLHAVFGWMLPEALPGASPAALF